MMSPVADAATILSTMGNRLDAPGPTHSKSDALAAAENFESQVIGLLTEQMFQGIQVDGPFGGGNGERVFRSLMLQEYGKLLTQSGGLGIADSVYREMLKLQEASNGTASL